ncbi:MAG: F0F1 ATP synthase subunit B [Bacteroidales bacterium]|nr:F0F1 ATP synthase subunit B [Bacteroidales bacterium]
MSLITPDFGLIFWMVVIFGVVFFILAKFGFPVITKAVQKRTDHIANSLKAAEMARQSVQEAQLERDRMLEQTRIEQGKIIQDTSRAREAMIAEARQKAQSEAADILRGAREEIAAEKESALREIRSEVSALSVAVAEKIVRKEIETTPEQLALLDRLADEAASAPLN